MNTISFLETQEWTTLVTEVKHLSTKESATYKEKRMIIYNV